MSPNLCYCKTDMYMLDLVNSLGIYVSDFLFTNLLIHFMFNSLLLIFYCCIFYSVDSIVKIMCMRFVSCLIMV